MLYTVNPTCGHEYETQLYGKGADRERRLEWMNRGVCPECYKAEQQKKRDEANAEAANKATENNRPELTGSEKQVAWATTLREQAIATMEQYIEDLQKAPVAEGHEAMAEQLFAEGHEYIEQLVAKETTAGYWIDGRDWSYRASIENAMSKIATKLLAENE